MLFKLFTRIKGFFINLFSPCQSVLSQIPYPSELSSQPVNPVVRGLVASPEDWKWSSFRHYQTGMRGAVEIESEGTARERGWQLPEWKRTSRAAPISTP